MATRRLKNHPNEKPSIIKKVEKVIKKYLEEDKKYKYKKNTGN